MGKPQRVDGIGVHQSSSVLDAIGGNPLIEVEDGIFAKLEFMNPSGSIKARIAKYMIERAENEGLLKPGMTIVEASSGNTGNAMSMVAAVKGYPMIVMMPGGMSSARLAISKAFGAEVREIGDFHVNDALAAAKELGQEEGYYSPGQFESEWNVEENRTWLGPEIVSQLAKGRLPDALVMGVGTGGTLIGVGQAFLEVNPKVMVVGVEPDESCTILCGEVHHHQIEGISDGFIPTIYHRHRHLVDEVLPVTSADALLAMYEIARNHGMFVGPSAGANLVASRRLKAMYPKLETIVTLFCDEGEKYLNEYFLAELPLQSGVTAPNAGLGEIDNIDLLTCSPANSGS
ncbi:MAG: PLP-dependent cysteine synthase family protein [Ferrimicrobium sp.]